MVGWERGKGGQVYELGSPCFPSPVRFGQGTEEGDVGVRKSQGTESVVWVQKEEEEGDTFKKGPGILVSSPPFIFGQGTEEEEVGVRKSLGTESVVCVQKEEEEGNTFKNGLGLLVSCLSLSLLRGQKM